MIWKVCFAEYHNENWDDKSLIWNTVFIGDLEEVYDHARKMGYWGCKLADFKAGTDSCTCLVGDSFLLKIERHNKPNHTQVPNDVAPQNGTECHHL